ncbi:MAG TPA: hypothetical protein PLV68_20295, partial [Ilumatobacteraceae bacterium]|nr:hypothetical protein [Ilumatobacteraceae bacterium]
GAGSAAASGGRPDTELDHVIERQDVAWHERPDDLSAFSRRLGPGQAVRTAADHGLTADGVAAGLVDHGPVDHGPVDDGPVRSGEPVRLMGRLARAGVSGQVALAERKPD